MTPYRRSRHGGKERDILIEFVVMGGSVKVTAIDSGTGLEACIVGPSSAPKAALEAAAARKLAYLMLKEKTGS